jgi:hypothetical protein
MLVTLEVSKLSGWLNADAICRESKGWHAIWGEVQGWEPGGVGRWRRKSGMHGGKPLLKAWGPGHARGAQRTCRACP